MKMHLRNKTILMRTKQSNYSNVFSGMILLSIVIALSILNFVIKISYFNEIIVALNILFFIYNLSFLVFLSQRSIQLVLKGYFIFIY